MVYSQSYTEEIGKLNITEDGELSRRLSEEMFRDSWPKWLFQLILAVIGTVSNSMVIASFRKQQHANVANYYIMFLASIDLFSCCVVIPLHVIQTAHYFNFYNTVACKLLEWFKNGTLATSSIILKATAVDRYQAVCRPFTWRKIGFRKTILLLCVCVFLGFFTTSMLLVIIGIQRYLVTESSVTAFGFSAEVFADLGYNQSYIYVCEALNYYDFSWENQAVRFLSLSIFIFLVTVVMILYTAIYCTMRRHSQNLQQKGLAVKSRNVVLPSNVQQDNLTPTDVNVKKTPSRSEFPTKRPLIKLPNDNPSSSSSTNQSINVTSFSERTAVPGNLHSNNIVHAVPAEGQAVNSTRSSKMRQNQYRAAKTLLIVTIVFILSWSPFWISVLLDAFGGLGTVYHSKSSQILRDFFRELFFVNNALNALVYYAYNTAFRNYCQDVLKCSKCKR